MVLANTVVTIILQYRSVPNQHIAHPTVYTILYVNDKKVRKNIVVPN